MKRGTLAIIVGLSFLVVFTGPTFLAQERIDADINARIRTEGQDNSKILRTMHYLTDVYGPRLTGSPNLKAAGEWAVKEMASWGFTNGHLEPWDFGRPGWTNDVAVGAILSPVKDKLEFEVLAWTPGTDGTVRAKAFNFIPPDRPTKEELEKYLESVKPSVENAIVLVGRSNPVPVNLEPPAKRTADESLRESIQRRARPRWTRGTRRARPRRVHCASRRRLVDERREPATERVPADEQREAPDQRCGARARADSRLPEQHLRHHQGRADGRDAQRRLRTHRPDPR